MPELPEVETIRVHLEKELVGKVLSKVVTDGSQRFISATSSSNKQVEKVSRRGKYLIVALDDFTEMLIHLGMTGQLLLNPGNVPHVRVTWNINNNILVLRDPRGFGGVTIHAPGIYTNMPTLANLGPEYDWPEFTVEHFFNIVSKSKTSIKAILLDQKVLAGVGNYIADEALWLSFIHPEATLLTETKARDLYNALLYVITASLKCGGVSMRDYVHLDGTFGTFGEHLNVYGKDGEACSRCATILLNKKVAGRSTTFCPTCQICSK
jgi:formamidopyrimidine-DNA glycosylase